MFKKILSVLLMINLVVCSTMILPTQFVTALENETAQSTDGNESALISTLTVYFNSRTMTTADAITASLCEITNPGMPEDEIKRMNLWKNQGIISITNSYSIDYFEASDILGVAYVTESISYSYTDNIENQYVTHYIEFSYNEDGSAHILMDSYAEPLINFESCSYLPDYLLSLADNTIGNETATNDHVNTGDYAYDVAQIALTQVGYLEKETNDQTLLYHKTANAGDKDFSKYAKDIGDNFSMQWCAAFVSWCAQEAGLEIGDRKAGYDNTVIPDQPFVPDMKEYYEDLGRFYDSTSYTPKIGDIFFANEGHVGIVVSVTPTKVNVVHGNSGENSVKYSTFRLSGTYITDYASPLYPTEESDHNYPNTDHTSSTAHECTYCGKISDFSWNHSHSSINANITHVCNLCDYTSTTTWEVDHDQDLVHVCPVCDYTVTGTWYHDHLVSMEHACTVCNYYKNGNWIENHSGNSTDHTCDLCGYEAESEWYGRHDRFDTHSCTLCGSTVNCPEINKVYEYNSLKHWEKCTVCNYKWAEEDHVWTAAVRGYNCLTCGAFSLTPGVDLTGDDSSESQ